MRVLVFLLWLPLAVFAQQSAQQGAQQSAQPSAQQGAQPMADDPVANARAVHLAEKLRCLVCQNQSIAESNAELAVDLKRQIREQIAAGRSEDEITGFMVDRYGDFVLYSPPVKLITLLLWFGPVTLLLVGLFVLLRNLRRRGAVEAPLSEEQKRAAAALLKSGGERQ